MNDKREAKYEKYRQDLLAQVSSHLGEPAEAVGLFTRAGGMAAAFTQYASPLAAAGIMRKGRQKGGGLPQNVIMAVTPATVHVLDFKPRGTKMKLKDTVATWPRSEVRVERFGEGLLSHKYRFDLPGGESIELDSTRMPGSDLDFNEPVMTALTP